jgi:hypothetical protein
MKNFPARPPRPIAGREDGFFIARRLPDARRAIAAPGPK